MRYMKDSQIMLLLICMLAVLATGVLTHLAGYSANKVMTTENGFYGGER